MDQETAQKITEVKSLRADITALVERVNKVIKTGGAGVAEATLCKRELQSSCHWLGETLREIDKTNPGAAPTPYPNSKDPSNTKIDPPAPELR